MYIKRNGNFCVIEIEIRCNLHVLPIMDVNCVINHGALVPELLLFLFLLYVQLSIGKISYNESIPQNIDLIEIDQI